ncbi:hypothetical protein BESB_078290 [Besnoitia besnoiti]|uniref:Uncharacterized protein n=1 Tax=Besnoitia besnoiti TaxID=94643 RepID=A0A2A9MD55_BESBE|nr:hypothetical protein BESB_078290 [Besnoitia besnoiti]PFH33613.1 hypothetical protein BESB_078290 [Besnoitia besnoiti]
MRTACQGDAGTSGKSPPAQAGGECVAPEARRSFSRLAPVAASGGTRPPSACMRPSPHAALCASSDSAGRDRRRRGGKAEWRERGSVGWRARGKLQARRCHLSRLRGSLVRRTPLPGNPRLPPFLVAPSQRDRVCEGGRGGGRSERGASGDRAVLRRPRNAVAAGAPSRGKATWRTAVDPQLASPGAQAGVVSASGAQCEVCFLREVACDGLRAARERGDRPAASGFHPRARAPAQRPYALERHALRPEAHAAVFLAGVRRERGRKAWHRRPHVRLHAGGTDEAPEETLRQTEQLLVKWLLPSLCASLRATAPAGGPRRRRADACCAKAEATAAGERGCGWGSHGGAETGGDGGGARQRGSRADPSRSPTPYAILAHLDEALELLLVKKAQQARGKAAKSAMSTQTARVGVSAGDHLEGAARLLALVLGYLILKRAPPSCHLQRLRDRLLLPSSPASQAPPSLAPPAQSALPAAQSVPQRPTAEDAGVATSLAAESVHHEVYVHRAVMLLVAYALYATAPCLAALLLDPFLQDDEARDHGAGQGRCVEETSSRIGGKTAYVLPQDWALPQTDYKGDKEISCAAKIREADCLYTSVTGLRWLLKQNRDGAFATAAVNPHSFATSHSQGHSSGSVSQLAASNSPSLACCSWKQEHDVLRQLAVSPEESSLIPSFLQVLPPACLRFRGFIALHFFPNLPR